MAKKKGKVPYGALEKAFERAEAEAGLKGATEALRKARKSKIAMKSTEAGRVYCCGNQVRFKGKDYSR